MLVALAKKQVISASDMRFMSTVLLAVVAIAYASAYNHKPHYDLNDAAQLFEQFAKDYNRHYKDPIDKYNHYLAFYLNLIKINQLNSEIDGATYDINQFADYTEGETKNLFGLKPPKANLLGVYQQ